jgi:AraC-like DNA-binding protein
MPGKAKDQRVPLTAIASAPRVLSEFGVVAEQVAQRAGLNPRCFDDPLQTISFEQMGRYLADCTLATNDDGFSFRVGLAEGPAALATLGFLVMNIASVRGALGTLQKYVHHFAGEMVLTQEQGLALLAYAFRYPRIQGAGFIVDGAMGLAIALLRALCGPSWSPSEVRFTRPLPSKPADWQRAVQAPVYFGAEQNLIVFSARWLDQPIERADPDLRRLLLDKVVELEARAAVDFPTRVAAVIRSSLLAGDASQTNVAGRLAISSATLKRRLASSGCSFSVLVDQTRMEMASQLLSNSRASMAQITDILGYGHSSTFSRAFGRWAGMSPRDWRAGRSTNSRDTSRRSKR